MIYDISESEYKGKKGFFAIRWISLRWGLTSLYNEANEIKEGKVRMIASIFN